MLHAFLHAHACGSMLHVMFCCNLRMCYETNSTNCVCITTRERTSSESLTSPRERERTVRRASTDGTRPAHRVTNQPTKPGVTARGLKRAKIRGLFGIWLTIIDRVGTKDVAVATGGLEEVHLYLYVGLITCT